MFQGRPAKLMPDRKFRSGGCECFLFVLGWSPRGDIGVERNMDDKPWRVIEHTESFTVEADAHCRSSCSASAVRGGSDGRDQRQHFPILHRVCVEQRGASAAQGDWRQRSPPLHDRHGGLCLRLTRCHGSTADCRRAQSIQHFSRMTRRDTALRSSGSARLFRNAGSRLYRRQGRLRHDLADNQQWKTPRCRG